MKFDINATLNICKSLIDQINEYANGEKINLQNNVNVLNNNSQNKNNTVVKITDVPPELLSSLTDNFLLIIEFINSYLLSINNAALYSSILMSMKFSMNFNQRGLIDIVFKNPIEMSFNPLFIDNMNVNELLTSVIDEIMKFVFNHPALYAKLNSEQDVNVHDKLEKASSTHSSEIILHDIRIGDGADNILQVPKKQYKISNLEKDLSNSGYEKHVSNNQTFEYYFEAAKLIKNNSSQNGQSGQSNNNSNNNNGNQSSNSSNPNALASPNNNNGNQTHNWEQNDADDISDRIKTSVMDAVNSLSEKSRGDIPAFLQEQLKKLFEKPRLNWKQMLRKYVGTIPEGHRSTKMRLNRRQPDRFDLCGKMTDTTLKIVIAIDTSGSMSSRELEYCFNEIFNILKVKKFDITVIECDSQIGKIYKPKKMKDIQLNVSGRGGTSFIPVIEYINNNKFKDAIMIYFTDGYGDYEIPRPRTFKNLWVIVGGGSESSLSLKNPYGEVRALKDDKDYRR